MNSADDPVPQDQRPSRFGWRREIFIALVGLIGVVGVFLVVGREVGLQGWFVEPPMRQEIASRDASEAVEEIEVIETDASPGSSEASWQPISLPAEPRRTSPKTPANAKKQVVTVSGKARDEAGNPVPNAVIRLMCLTAKPSLVATTNSGADGQFVFRDVEFVLRSNPDADFSAFSLMATAPTFGLSWLSWIYFLDCPRPTSPLPFAGQHLLPDTTEATFRDEPVRVTLTFGQPAVIEGQVISDTGDGVMDAEVQVQNVELLAHVGQPTQLASRRFPSTDWLPEQLRVARTDASGSFRIVGLPANALVGISVKRADFVNSGVVTTTAQKRLTEVTVLHNQQIRDSNGRVTHEPLKAQQKVQPSPLQIRLLRPRLVFIEVQAGDSKLPLKDVVLSAVGYQNSRALSEYLQTRSSTKALLVPDKYWLDAKPMEDSGYVTSHRDLEVTTSFEPQSHTIEVDRAATVDFEVIDADTGGGVSEVQFWTVPQPPFQRQQMTGKAGPMPKRVPVQSDVYHPRTAKTDRNGRLRVSLRASARRSFEINLTGHLDYVAVKAESDEVELRAGETTKVRFEVKKRDVANLIRGRCLDLDDRPVEKVEVGLYRVSRDESGQSQRELIRSTLSDKRGEYELGELPISLLMHDSYEIRGRRSGFATAVGGRFLRMKPGFNMVGHVWLPNGQPASGAKVSPGNSEFTLTNSEGEFELQGMEDFGAKSLRAYRLFVTHADYGQKVVDFRNREPRMDVQFAEPAVLRGKVVDPDIRPVSGALVQVRNRTGIGSCMTRTDASGQFEVRLQESSQYTVSVSHDQFIAPPLGHPRRSAEIPPEFAVADGGVEAVLGEVRHAPIIHMERPSQLVGRVIDQATGEPLRLRPGDLMSVVSHGPWSPTPSKPFDGLVDAGGSFRLTAVPGRNHPWLWIRSSDVVYTIVSEGNQEVDIPLLGEATIDFTVARVLP